MYLEQAWCLCSHQWSSTRVDEGSVGVELLFAVQANRRKEERKQMQKYAVSHKSKICSTWSCESFCLKENGLNGVLVSEHQC